MKIVLLGLLLSSTTAMAADAYRVKTDLNYTSPQKKEISVSTEVGIAADNTNWLVISKSETVIVLARATKSNKDTLQMEYLVIDTDQEKSVVSNPSIRTKWGSPAQITIGDIGQKPTLSVSVLATKTSSTQ